MAGEVVLINGYAGTGKTTLLGVMADEVGEIAILTPTGKAAIRVQEATHQRAKTIHQWLYRPVEDPRTGITSFVLKEKEHITIPASRMVVIDEGSMVGPEMWQDLIKMAVLLDFRIVVMMDEFQLPPVQKKDDPPFSLADQSIAKRSRVDLTEVTRQALESPIIRASMDLRSGDTIRALMGHGIDTEPNLLAAAIKTYDSGGVIVCHRNSTRHTLNAQIRNSKGFRDDEINPGEPLLVLKNNYGLYIFNGEVVTFDRWIRPPTMPYTCLDFYSKEEIQIKFARAALKGAFASYSSEPEAILAVEEIFGKTEGFSQTAIAKTARGVFGDGYNHLHANFGYVLTAHKAQGSEWPTALVVIENTINPHVREGRRWIYTALTRAKQNVTIHWAG